MNIENTIKDQINQVIEKEYCLKDFKFQIEEPKDKIYGDYTTNAAMLLAKKRKSDPIKIGNEIIDKLNKAKKKKSVQLSEYFSKIRVVKPGFINFYLADDFLKNELAHILDNGDEYGRTNEGNGRTIVVDYSAPNIAKKMHVGHLRSTIIGSSICRVYSFLGYRVIGDNHLGDWGTQFGKIIFMYKRKYGEVIKDDMTVGEMESMYVDFHKKEKIDLGFAGKARAELKKLQNKDKFNYRLWQLFCKISISEFKKIYKVLDVDFDLWRGESFYNDMLQEVVEAALNGRIAKRSEGAVVIPLKKYGLPDFLIQKSDEAFLYSTTDLATIKYRHEKYNPIKNIYVVASQQELYFKQLFKTSELLGLSSNEEMIHVKFGLILGANGRKMSTREGEVADLRNIINEGISKAKKLMTKKNPDLTGDGLESAAAIVAIGAIKYNDLSQNRLTDVKFDWDKMLALESGSAPYLQYTYVRIKSIFSRIGFEFDSLQKNIDLSLLGRSNEMILIRDLVRFPGIVKRVLSEHRLNLITIYLEELAKDFHNFYENSSVLRSEKNLAVARLGLLKAVARIMKNGLFLLGIDTPDRM